MLDFPTIQAPAGIDLDQYFGLWSIEPTRFESLLRVVAGMDLSVHVAGNPPVVQANATTRGTAAGSVAVIEVNGVMTKRGSSLSGAGSTSAIRRILRTASHDDSVGSILLKIDSPGGTVSGTADLARDVSAAAERKPVYAFAEDLTASAAYWIASQADKVFANDKTALVGSIGTFVGLYDYSKAAEDAGIKAVVVKSGEFKAAGFPGTEISEDQIAKVQEIVDATQEQFNTTIARGRGLSLEQVRNVADGRLRTATEAESAGLIDGIKTFEQVLNQLSQEMKGRRMSTDNNPQPKAASYSDLKACLPGADNDFICSCLDKGLTVDGATSAWMEEQNRRIEAAREETESAKAAAAPKPGAPTVGAGTPVESGDGRSAIEQWNEEIEKLVSRGRPRSAAVSRVNIMFPGLRERVVAEANA